MMKVRIFYRVMALICLVASFVLMAHGGDATDIIIAWVTFWGMMIMGEVTK